MSGAFRVAGLWTPTAAFESLGLRYLRVHYAPLHEQPEGVVVE